MQQVRLRQHACTSSVRIEFCHETPAGLKKHHVSPAHSCTAMQKTSHFLYGTRTWRSQGTLVLAGFVCIDALLVTRNVHLVRKCFACLTSRCMCAYGVAPRSSVLRCCKSRLSTTLHLRLPRPFTDRPLQLAHRGIVHIQFKPGRQLDQVSVKRRANSEGRVNMAGDLVMIGKAWSMVTLISIFLRPIASACTNSFNNLCGTIYCSIIP